VRTSATWDFDKPFCGQCGSAQPDEKTDTGGLAAQSGTDTAGMGLPGNAVAAFFKEGADEQRNGFQAGPELTATGQFTSSDKKTKIKRCGKVFFIIDKRTGQHGQANVKYGGLTGASVKL
jgi:hypothetical protein